MVKMSIKEQVLKANGYYKKAMEKKELVEYCIHKGFYNMSISESYYYIFNLCRAIMTLYGNDTKSHKTLIGNFNKIMIHEREIFNRSYGSLLTTLEKQRDMCDYESNYFIPKDFALYLYEQSNLFGQELINYYRALEAMKQQDAELSQEEEGLER